MQARNFERKSAFPGIFRSLVAASFIPIALIALYFLLYSSTAAGTPGAKKTPIAFIAGFTGPDQDTARELERGVEVFLHQNKDAADKLEIVKFDNKGSPEDTIRILREVHKHGIKFVLGPVSSDEALTAAKFTETHDMLQIAPFATNPELTRNKPLTFRTCSSDIEQGRFLAQFATQELKAKKILVLVNVESLYSQGLADAFAEEIKRSGRGTILARAEYTDKDLRIQDVDGAFFDLQPDAVFMPDGLSRVSRIVKHINGIKKGVSFLSGDAMGGRKLFMGYFAAETNLRLYYSTHWNKNIKVKTNLDLLETYAELFRSDEPTTGTSLAFDSMAILWESLKSLETDFPTPAAVASRIRGGTFQSATGAIKFDKQPDNSPTRELYLMKYVNGVYSIHDSDKLAQTKETPGRESGNGLNH